jgi:hypothetical protein
VKAARVKPLSEAEFTRQVIALAKLRGWRDATRATGETG